MTLWMLNICHALSKIAHIPNKIIFNDMWYYIFMICEITFLWYVKLHFDDMWNYIFIICEITFLLYVKLHFHHTPSFYIFYNMWNYIFMKCEITFLWNVKLHFYEMWNYIFYDMWNYNLKKCRFFSEVFRRVYEENIVQGGSGEAWNDISC